MSLTYKPSSEPVHISHPKSCHAIPAPKRCTMQSATPTFAPLSHAPLSFQNRLLLNHALTTNPHGNTKSINLSSQIRLAREANSPLYNLRSPLS